MTSTLGLPPAATRSAAACIRARTCMPYRPGLDHAEAHAPGAEHGIELVPGFGRTEQLLLLRRQTLGRLLDAQLLDRWQELVQRRVEQAHRDRQPVHGLQDGDEVLLLGARAAPPGRQPPRPSSPARIMRRTIGSRSSARNMCSVRHSPIPSAPKRRALAASGPLSALARTASCPLRTLSAQPRMTSNSAGGVRVLEPDFAQGDLARSCRRSRCMSPSRNRSTPTGEAAGPRSAPTRRRPPPACPNRGPPRRHG